MGTDTWPAIQIARSASIQWALFLPRMATQLPAGQPCAFSQAAMRRTSSPASRQVMSRTAPPPVGWVRTILSALCRSQWKKRCSGSSLSVMAMGLLSVMVQEGDGG